MRSSAGRSKAGKDDDSPRRSGAAASRRRAADSESDAPAAPKSAPKSRAIARPRKTGARLGPLALLEAVDRGEFPSTLYLEGDSEPVKAALLAALRAAWAEACPVSPLARVFRAAETSPEEITAAYQGASLFSPRDLVILLEIEDWGRSEKRVTALADVIERAASPSSLVLVKSASETTRKALEPLRQAARTRVDATPPTAAELARWGERRFAREGFTAERGVMAALAESCEGDALAYFSELDKLCVWAARDHKLSLADARMLLQPSVGSELPDYLAAVASGDTRTATRRLGRLLAAGVGEGAILFSLSNMVGGALGGWSRNPDLSSALRRRSHPVQLSKALDACYRAEAAWKGGRADVVAVLEQVTRAICGNAAAA